VSIEDQRYRRASHCENLREKFQQSEMKTESRYKGLKSEAQQQKINIHKRKG